MFSFFLRIRDFLFKNTTARQMVFKNAFWLGTGTSISRIIRAIVVIYAARVLGTEGYGIFSYAMSFAAFFSVFSDIGLAGLLTREVSREPERAKAYIATTFAIKLVITAITVTVLLVASPFLIRLEAARSLLPFIALLMIFDGLRMHGFAITRAQNRMEIEAILTIATEIFLTAGSVYLLLTHPSASGLALTYAIGSGLGLILTTFMLRKNLKDIFTHYDKKLVRPLLHSAWPFAIMGVLSGFLINIDTIILGIFRTEHELGLYAAAQRPIQLLYVIPGLLSASIFPILNRMIHTKDKYKIRSILEKSIAGVISFALPISVGGLLVAQPLIILLFGAPYEGATLAFQFLLLTIPLVFPGILIGNTIFTYDRQKIFILSAGLGAVMNVVFDLLLIPSYGIAGCAFATLVAQIFVNGINWVSLRKISPFTIFPGMKNVLLATTIMGIITFVTITVGTPVIVSIILGALTYIGTLWYRKDPLFLEFIRPRH